MRTVDLVPSAGVFWDRHNSLMASLLYANTQTYRLRLNVYPGVLKLAGWSPGLFAALNRNERFEAASRSAPGFHSASRPEHTEQRGSA